MQNNQNDDSFKALIKKYKYYFIAPIVLVLILLIAVIFISESNSLEIPFFYTIY